MAIGKVKRIGILTAGGDCPGLNAAIRAAGKTAIGHYGIEVIGFRDGFRGMAEKRTVPIDKTLLSGILTIGGTILGTSRDKIHKMEFQGHVKDMTGILVANYKALRLDCLICIGGGGTQKNALRLSQAGINIITLPKTLDNDVAKTDATIGFATALDIATEAIDRLHSTAHSHHRIVVTEIMGHRAGWLALGAGIAGGADVILIPEIPYDVQQIAAAIRRRSRHGTNFSIVAVAEGSLSAQDAPILQQAEERKRNASNLKDKAAARLLVQQLRAKHEGNTLRLAAQLEELTHLESRVTILGYVQRGGTPSAADRILATRLGTACVDYIQKGVFGVMIAARADSFEPVPLSQVATQRKTVPLDHPWITSARRVGTCLGD
jgi:ATP-dependent phosphofructokinase / diphosphate-dependent phosphofructokinase